MMSFIKWSGSKRSQAKTIVSIIKELEFDTYYEPFLGSGAILGELKPEKAIISDIYEPLVMLWNEIKNDPKSVIENYEKQWSKLQEIGHTYFYEVRDRFNKNKDPLDLLFLSRTCVNGLIRFNSKGQFNNALHHSRKGMNPQKFASIVDQWNQLLKEYKISVGDYRKITETATKNDVIYLDPPYFNNKNRYLENIDHEAFFKYLGELNKKSIRYVLSYDGHSESKNYDHPLPKELYKRHLKVHSGLSAFKKVQDKQKDNVHESLYLNF
ncbi:Dam family site-specific DNA-(adenine-N6)-methyltransferase [Candidatus Saccharibacteria bacterium]|nr:Dam family site-specific DNA-(adenine-N6)-methyltransferase [Candidatus Saccharibacteria bacterium]